MLNEVEIILNQVKLTALNVAFEAVKAGDAGRGYFDVADKVRKLSINSDNLNVEIKDILETAQNTIVESRENIKQHQTSEMEITASGGPEPDRPVSPLQELDNYLRVSLQEILTINKKPC